MNIAVYLSQNKWFITWNHCCKKDIKTLLKIDAFILWKCIITVFTMQVIASPNYCLYYQYHILFTWLRAEVSFACSHVPIFYWKPKGTFRENFDILYYLFQCSEISHTDVKRNSAAFLFSWIFFILIFLKFSNIFIEPQNLPLPSFESRETWFVLFESAYLPLQTTVFKFLISSYFFRNFWKFKI